jgi:hypothetical protein
MKLLDIEAYAMLVVELAEGARPRDVILQAQNLDEAAWEALDAHWQAELSGAMATEEDGIPPLAAAYADAFRRARAAFRTDSEVLSIERYAHAMREIQQRGDPTAALAHAGIPLAAFLKASEHWMQRMASDPAILERFRRAMKAR